MTRNGSATRFRPHGYGEFPRRPGWCVEHQDFGWIHPDKSGGCLYVCEVEIGSSDCHLVPLQALKRAKR